MLVGIIALYSAWYVMGQTLTSTVTSLLLGVTLACELRAACVFQPQFRFHRGRVRLALTGSYR